MRLRFVEDRRTMFWAFVLFPLGPALALWRPSALPWLAPLLLYCSYLSGVLSHNQNHCPVFHARWANLGYQAWLSFFYGFPIFAWLPTHNQNHHRYLNGEGDVTRTSRSPHDGLFTFLAYPLVSSRFQLPLVLRSARQALRRRSPLAGRVLLESGALFAGHLGAAALAVTLHGLPLGAVVYLAAFGAPALLGSYWMMLTNYLQHVDCDPKSEHDHSRNFVSPLWNWFVFDNGYHTVHHQHPGLHWSRYRALHRLSAARISPALSHPSLVHYALARYLLGSAREPALPANETESLTVSS